ncbi:hypothetical protein [Pseudomonas sp. 2FE]|uniref:hypothetical protein n=1 Tax=Pseudomonas sp. 2FE TaxID=2502190 RepID=UPI00211529C6|nr:hypothetical protein [Pseudomonas sp. 2FE]
MQALKIGSNHFEIDNHPDVCPHCHHAIKAEFIEALMYNSGKCIDAAYRCPKNDCHRLFVAVFKRLQVNFTELSKHFALQVTYPRNPIAPDIPEEAKEVSPQFVEIFTQSAKAEAFELSAIAGVGYRKALEFLIKDYCTTKFPDKADEVKSRPLGQVIDTYVDNENIKQCAKRAVWLGNDETHYVRTWIDKDIKDLKLLIKLTVGWIEQAIITEQLIQDMQKP